MTISELVKLLQTYPPDARVVVLGYENGYDDITLVKEIAIVPAGDPAWYDGRYDVPEPSGTVQAERAVLVYGRNREE